MPESDFTPEDSLNEDRFGRVADERLNASELQTVLDMLAVMETTEELSQLQALTETQKRQVWEATPETLKQKLWQLRNPPALSEKAASIGAANFQKSEQESETEESETDLETELDDEIEDLGQDLDLTQDSYSSVQIQLTGTGTGQPNLDIANQPSEPLYADRSIPSVGDRIILKAHSKLTASELKAIWQLERIQGSDGYVSHSILGTRSYPLTWMVVYARAQPEQAEDLADDLDSEEAF